MNHLNMNKNFFKALDAVLAFSRSISDDSDYNFRFDEPFAYSETTNDQSIEAILAKMIQPICILVDTISITSVKRREKTFGVNIKYDFRLTNNISGNIKFGNKLRTKKRTYDRHLEYADISSFNAGSGGKSCSCRYIKCGSFNGT